MSYLSASETAALNFSALLPPSPPPSPSSSRKALSLSLSLQLPSDTPTITTTSLHLSSCPQPAQLPSISRPPPPSHRLLVALSTIGIWTLSVTHHTHSPTTCLNSHAPAPAHRTAFRLSPPSLPPFFGSELPLPRPTQAHTQPPPDPNTRPRQALYYHHHPARSPPLHLHVFLRKPPKV